ncbi:MAG: YlxR family protein [Candidatus Lutibacillus vidarii]|nr:YlxR family protein [Candidatus Lutibacillus vidarii]HON73724.1 YlxR family protein [Dermatophilaceae bacterium]
MPTDRSGLRATAPHSPSRTCVGCRRADSRSALLRVVAALDQSGTASVVPDVRGRLPGRGAWLHPTLECLEHARRRRAFGRALRVQGATDDGAVAAYLGDLTQ